ncbi:MAG TPA: isoamylase early set domain-containing protein [Verrucomicrobiae bacterium]
MAKAKIPKHKVTFELLAPEAREVRLAGDFTDWERSPIALEKKKDGKWQMEISLPCGMYEYRYVVDGQWVTDPQANMRHLNAFGTENSVLMVAMDHPAV